MAGASSKTSPDLSIATKGILAIVATAGAIGALAMLNPNNKTVIGILVVAVLVLVVLLVLYRLLLAWLRARKAAPFTQNLTSAAGSTPNAISGAASRAKLDDLRRNFETGVSRFHATGKDLYRLPWYLVIGEPGSGKTEAIRHSGIPFPPGLHDQLQGAGGTVNMNWWFTNEAVILDTAGRYLFDEVQPGASAEWTEFLKLLAMNRPQCPINGLLLVIPANSLILDNSDKIAEKAGKIAQQLDRIQRTLDVRFPVFVVVTKCDLINGFREFFDGLNDQRQQHQILGWSNDAPLDEVFKSDMVDEHMKTVHGRLMERRLGLLLDPVSRESDDAKRIDEVDALYSMPDSFLRVGPQLRQYLEMIFVAGEWSPKPLFLRGIYFTSSMREGQALDAELAELLGVPVDSLSEGRMWERDRAFFLRDLFVKKVFPEKGLVTRAASAKKVERNRRGALLAAGFAATLALLGFTWVGKNQLDDSVRVQADELNAIKDLDFRIVSVPDNAAGGKIAPAHSRLEDKCPVTYGPNDTRMKTVGEIHALLLEEQRQTVKIPLVLRPAAGIIDHSVNSDNLNASKNQVYQKIYAGTVLAPLVMAVDNRFRAENTHHTWSDSSTLALGEMVQLVSLRQPDLTALFSYAVGDDPASKAPSGKDVNTLQQGLKLLRLRDGKWPEPVHIDDQSMDAGEKEFVEYWDRQIASATIGFQKLVQTTGEPAQLQAAHNELTRVCMEICQRPPRTSEDYQRSVKSWNEAFAKYDTASEAMKSRLNILMPASGDKALVELCNAAHGGAQEQARKAYDDLLARFPTPPAVNLTASPTEAEPSDLLSKLRKQLEDSRKKLESPVSPAVLAGLDKIDNAFLKQTVVGDVPTERPFIVTHKMYLAANSAVPDGPGGAAKVLVPEAHTNVENLSKTLPDKTQADKDASGAASHNCNILLYALATPRVNYDAAARPLDANPKPFRTMVIDEATSRPVHSELLTINLTSINEFQIKPDFDAASMAAVVKRQQKAVNSIRDNADKMVPVGECNVPFMLNGALLKERALTCQAEIDANVAEYIAYYRMLLANAGKPSLPATISWEKLQEVELPHISSNDVMENQKKLGQTAFDAMGQIETLLPSSSSRLVEIAGVKAAADQGLNELKSNEKKFVDRINHWRDLGSNAVNARDQILKLKARDFGNEYRFATDAKSDFVTAYWNSLVSQIMRVLVTMPNVAVMKCLTDFRSRDFQKFPLNPTAVDELTPAQVELLRAELVPVDPPPAIAAGGAGIGDQLIKEGGRLNEGSEMNAINAELNTLAGGGVKPADWKTIKNLKELLDALPRPNASLTCDISVPPIAEQKKLREKWSPARDYLGPKLHYIELQANKLELGLVELNEPPPGGALGRVTLPMDGAIKFNFYKGREQQLVRKTDAVSLPPMPPHATPKATDVWQCLRFIVSKDNPVQPPAGVKWDSWDVEQIQTINHLDYSVWIRLKFEKPLPGRQDWPQ